MSKADGVILGEFKGNAICMPKDTRLNRHIAIFSASCTMKSRAIIRNALFQFLKHGESVVITDPKGELYADTSGGTGTSTTSGRGTGEKAGP